MEREGAGGRAGPRSLGAPAQSTRQAPAFSPSSRGVASDTMSGLYLATRFLRACVFLKRANAPFSPHDDILNTRLQSCCDALKETLRGHQASPQCTDICTPGGTGPVRQGCALSALTAPT